MKKVEMVPGEELPPKSMVEFVLTVIVKTIDAECDSNKRSDQGAIQYIMIMIWMNGETPSWSMLDCG